MEKTKGTGTSKGKGEKKLRILALHGYGQTAEDFKQKSKTFRKKIDKIAHFEFIDAPFEFVNIDDKKGRSWIKNTPPPDSPLESFCAMTEYEGIDESLEIIKKELKQNAYDGILGFSQGGIVNALLCKLCWIGELEELKFFIIVSAFKPSAEKFGFLFSRENSLVRPEPPNLHIYGTGDDIVPYKLSEELAGMFGNPIKIEHKGKHHLPTKGKEKKEIEAFLTKFLD